MLPSLRNLFKPAAATAGPAVPAGSRVYAIGDIHGCDRQFAALIDAIEADDHARGAAETTVVLLGDLVDRGPDSAGVIRRAREWSMRREVRLLLGNHEEMFLDSFSSSDVLRHFLRYGGRETLLSYPITPDDYAKADLDQTRSLMAAAVPQADIAFLQGGEDMIAIGGYLFVHAGIQPGVALDQQTPRELRWIREPFLSHAGAFGPVVVHGHTITEQAQVRRNRIGIDTGAYRTGRLTALGLEGTARWIIEVQADEHRCTVSQRRIS